MTTISAKLEHIIAPVIAMRPPTNQPQLSVGFIEDSPVGHCVGLGVAASMPGGEGGHGLCLMAHIDPRQARDLAAKLLIAAERAERAGPSSSPFQPKSPAAPANDGPEVPNKPHIQGQAIGFNCQIQKGSDQPAALEDGTLAIMAQPSPGDGSPILCIHFGHPDGSSLAALLDAVEVAKFLDLFSEGAEQFAAITRAHVGAPPGVSVQ